MNDIPIYIMCIHTHTHTRLSIHLSMNIWAFSTSWLLCLMLLWNGCTNTSSISILWRINSRVGLQDRRMALCLIFWGPAILFSTMAAPFYIPANGARGCQFLHILTSTGCFLFRGISCFVFADGHRHGCEVVSQSGFDLRLFTSFCRC